MSSPAAEQRGINPRPPLADLKKMSLHSPDGGSVGSGMGLIYCKHWPFSQ